MRSRESSRDARREDRGGGALRYWLERSRDALASARDEERSGRLAFAVNRCYYAAFYAVSAVLLVRGHRFVKHSGVRTAFHQHLVKPGIVSDAWGRFYDRLFQDRQEGDYLEFATFADDEVRETLAKVADLVAALEVLLPGQKA